MKYVKIKPSKTLNAYIQRHSQSLLRRMSKSDGRYKLSMSIQPVSTREHFVKTYVVKGDIAIRGQTHLRASKKSADPEEAVLAVVEALEKQLRRLTEKEESSRKTIGRSLKPVREFKWEFSKL